MDDKIYDQILSIRDSGVCNMFDTAAVQNAAVTKRYYELVVFIEEEKKEYSEFILTGER